MRQLNSLLTSVWLVAPEASLGADHIDGFFTELAHDGAPGTTTSLRYLKLIDRLTRHLVNVELRADNPAAQMLVNENCPQDEPTSIYLSSDDDARLQAVCVATDDVAFKDLRNKSIVALFLASGVTAAEIRQSRVDDLDVHGERATVFVGKHRSRIARRMPIDAFATDVSRTYRDARNRIQTPTQWLFVATASGKPMQPDTMLKCGRLGLRCADLSAADESLRLLRNTFGRRQIIADKTHEQVSSFVGLSSHRTATRLRQTIV